MAYARIAAASFRPGRGARRPYRPSHEGGVRAGGAIAGNPIRPPGVTPPIRPASISFHARVRDGINVEMPWLPPFWTYRPVGMPTLARYAAVDCGYCVGMLSS